MENIEGSPLGWEIDLLYLFAHCATIMVEDIDQQLKNRFGGKDGFVGEKKRAIKDYEDCIKKAKDWFNRSEDVMQKFDLDGSTYDAVECHNKRYSNVIASANELIRAAMLVVDRSNCENGSYKIFKRLRSLPEQGIFPEWFIERFQMKYEVIFEPGDRIRSSTHGDGTLDFHTGNGNWNCKFDNGLEIIQNEKQLTLL